MYSNILDFNPLTLIPLGHQIMTETKQKKPRHSADKVFLKNLISFLEKEPLTKDQLAKKLGLDGGKKVTDTILLAAVRLAGNSDFLKNIKEKTGGRVRRNQPQYSAKKGLVIPAWQFDGKDVVDGQKYEMTFGSRKGIITLRPVDDGGAAGE
jgi:hypothetical protein